MTLKELYNKFIGGVASVWNGFTGFLGRHKYAIGVTLLGLIAGAAFAAALIFFFPATIGTIIGLTAALPFVGAPVAAFLSGLGLVGAAAVIGSAATAVTWAAGSVGYGVVQTLRFIGSVFVGAYKGARNELVGAPPVQATQDNVEAAKDELNASVEAARDAVNNAVDRKGNVVANHVVDNVSRTVTAAKDSIHNDVTEVAKDVKAKFKKVKEANNVLEKEVGELRQIVKAQNKKLDNVTGMLVALMPRNVAPAPARRAPTTTTSSSSVFPFAAPVEKKAAQETASFEMTSFPTAPSATPSATEKKRASGELTVGGNPFTFHAAPTTTTTTTTTTADTATPEPTNNAHAL